MRFASSMTEITDSPDTKPWCEFVLNHPHGNIFQTPEMAEVYRRTKNYEPVTLAAVDTKPFFKKEILSFTKEILYFIDNEILAVLQAVVIKELSGVLGSFSARAIIQGGPLFVENETGIKALYFTDMLTERSPESVEYVNVHRPKLPAYRTTFRIRMRKQCPGGLVGIALDS